MMKKIIYFSLAILMFSFTSKAQSVSMIGDGVSGWGTDVVMATTDNVNYTLSSFTFSAGSAKFRLNISWDTNWGANAFPSGTATLNGSNIPVPAGVFNVSFNRTTGVFAFTSAATGFDAISITGAAGPGADEDVAMSTVDGINYVLDNYALTTGGLKFRKDSSNTTTWGSASFPNGTATVGGASIVVTAGTYNIKFNKTSGVYSFSFPIVSMIGSAASGWSTDVNMTTTNGVNYTLEPTAFVTGDLKFRLNNTWSTNWGSNGFPSGTGSLGGSNVPVVAGTYSVTFNRNTAAYVFSAGYSVISLFEGSSDIDLITLNGVNYYANNLTIASGNYKFRQAHSSAINWGSTGFPSGTATAGGASIPVVGGTYNITFNKTTGVYSFDYVVVSIIGSATPGGWSADTNMTTTDGNNYTLSGVALVMGDVKFRQGADWSVNWGANTFPGGTGTSGGSNVPVSVASTYTVHFNRLTQVYYFYNEISPNVNTPINLCKSSIATSLTATPLPGNTLRWFTVATGGTSTAIAPKPPTSVIGTRTYFVSQVTPGGVVGPRTPIVVNVVDVPTAPLAITANYNNALIASTTLGNYIGTSLPVVYSVANVLNATSYQWTVPSDVNIVSGQGTNTLTVNFLNAAVTTGTFAVSVKSVSVFGCASLARTLSGTKALPATPGIISTSLANVCAVVGLPDAYVNYSVVQAPGVSYTWTVPTGATIFSGQGTNAITVNFSTGFALTGSVTARAVNALGSSIATRSLLVTRSLPAIPGVPVGQTSAICPTIGAYNYSMTAPLNATNWTITGPIGSMVRSVSNPSNMTNVLNNTTTTTFSISYPSAFVSGSIVIVARNGCAVSAARTTAVNRLLTTPLSIAGPTALACTFTTIGTNYTTPIDPLATSYTWTVPAGSSIVSGQGTNAIVVMFTNALAATSILTVRKSTNVCGAVVNSLSRAITLTKPVCRLAEIGSAYSEVYPNPANSSFNVDVKSENATNLTVELYNFTGNIVSDVKYRLEKGENTIKTDISNLPNGLYVARFIDPTTNSVETKKIIKK